MIVIEFFAVAIKNAFAIHSISVKFEMAADLFLFSFIPILWKKIIFK